MSFRPTTCGNISMRLWPIICSRGIPSSSSPARLNRTNDSCFASFMNTIAGMFSSTVSSSFGRTPEQPLESTLARRVRA